MSRRNPSKLARCTAERVAISDRATAREEALAEELQEAKAALDEKEPVGV